jgi:hypothetical protein
VKAGDSVLVYSTYLGGSHQDATTVVAVDSADEVCVTGTTTPRNFPVSEITARPIPAAPALLPAQTAASAQRSTQRRRGRERHRSPSPITPAAARRASRSWAPALRRLWISRLPRDRLNLGSGRQYRKLDGYYYAGQWPQSVGKFRVHGVAVAGGLQLLSKFRDTNGRAATTSMSIGATTTTTGHELFCRALLPGPRRALCLSLLVRSNQTTRKAAVAAISGCPGSHRDDGCGSGLSSSKTTPGTSAGTYTITVNASSGRGASATSHAAKVIFTVQ